jgi:hypothetical protein
LRASIIIDHIPTLKVSVPGSSVLEEDIKNYQDLFVSFEEEQVLREFQALKQLCNIFKVSDYND